MDTEMILATGIDIGCFRLQSARRKKRMQYKGFKQYLRNLDRLEDELRRQKDSLGWAPLIPPVMRGWKRSFVLREDVAKSKEADFFAGILGKINTIQYSHRKDFKEKKRKRGRKIRVEKPQHLREWDRYYCRYGLQLTAKELLFFDMREVWRKDGRFSHWRYVFREPWRFVLRVEPNMITQIRIRDEVLESQIGELNAIIESRFLRYKMKKMRHRHYHWWGENYERIREKNDLRNKSFSRILDEHYLQTKEQSWPD